MCRSLNQRLPPSTFVACLMAFGQLPFAHDNAPFAKN